MRKSLFAIGLLAAVSSVQAQNVLLHVDDTATTYVSKGTLVYSGGGVQMRGNGVVDNHGNFMVSGTATDSFKTITTGNTDKPEGSTTANFINRLNEPGQYDQPASLDPANPNYTYGQLYITGVPQSNITGIVDEEVRQIKHGDYQQMGVPFFQKSVASLGADVGKTFSPVRGSKNDVLYWHNTDVKAVHFGDLNLYKFGDAAPSTAYYMIGGQGLDLTTTKTVKGRPVSDDGTFANTPATLSNAGANVNFGTNGQGHNSYNEAYNTYVADEFNASSGKWQGNYGKNMYQFANPYLTNLDLTNIGIAEANGDGVSLNNIYGVRTEATGVKYTGTGSTAAAYKVVTFLSGVPTGDVSSTMVRPFGAFTIKLTDNVNTGNTTLNFANLRRFNYLGRSSGTAYSVTAAKNGATGTVKQLGVIALDANGKELDRTYYVVYPNGTTGHTSAQKIQYAADTANLLGTFEEAPTGGMDPNYSSNYWLYINEANETDFKGKNVSLMNYSPLIKSYKFEIRENAELVSNGAHQLSTGTGFFYKAPNGNVMEAKQGETIPVTTNTLPYDLYYGAPDRNLGTKPDIIVKSSRTMVVYNPEITNYIVRFDPNWKKADIEVYDMSGKLVISKKAVNTSTDFVIELDNSIKNSYVVKIVSDKGETVNTKILK